MAAKRATKKVKNSAAKNLDVPNVGHMEPVAAADSVLELALAGLDAAPNEQPDVTTPETTSDTTPETTSDTAAEQETDEQPASAAPESTGRKISARAEAFIKALLAQYGPGISGATFPEILAALAADRQVVVTVERVVEVVDSPPFATYDRKSDVRGPKVLINVGRALVHAKHF
jgi:hypothetical protein